MRLPMPPLGASGREMCANCRAQMDSALQENLRFRGALTRLTNGFKYPTEVVRLARDAIGMTDTEADCLARRPTDTQTTGCISDINERMFPSREIDILRPADLGNQRE